MKRAVPATLLLVLAPVCASAQALRYSTDTVVELGNTLVEGMSIVLDDGAGGISTQSFAYIDDTATLTAYHRATSGDFLFVLDTAVAVGGVTFRAGEVLRASDDNVLSEFDPVESGVPRGVEVDAVGMMDGGLVLSFDSDVELGGTFYADEDLVRLAGSAFSMALDGSNFGLPVSADIDAAHASDDGGWRLSFDTSGSVGGVTYRGQDVVALNPGTGAWSMAYDASERVTGWGDAGLDAVWFAPVLEPGQLQWSRSSVSVAEDAGQVTLTITRTNGTDGTVAVDYETVADSAVAGDDFVPASGNAALDDSQTTFELDITIVDDADIEAPEQFFVDLSEVTSGGATLGSPTRVTVTIQDDEDMVFADGFESVP